MSEILEPPPYTNNRSLDRPIVLGYMSTYTKSEQVGSSIQHMVNDDELYCRLCGAYFQQNKDLHAKHFNDHWKKLITFDAESTDKDPIEKSTCLDELKLPLGNLKLTLGLAGLNITSKMSMTLHNTYCHNIHLKDLFLFNSEVPVALLDVPKILEPGEKYKIALEKCAYDTGTHNVHVVRYSLLPVNTELIELHNLEECCSSNGTLQIIKLPKNAMMVDMGSIVQNRMVENVFPCQLNRYNYVQTLAHFISLEEDAIALEIQKVKCQIQFTNTTFVPIKNKPPTYSLKIPKDFPTLNKMNRFWMYPKGGGVRIRATVTDIIWNDIRNIKVDTEPTFYETYTIILDDKQFQAERYALHIMEKFNLIKFLFPSMTPAPSAMEMSANIQTLKFFNENIEKNPEQHQAVLAIVNGVSYPAPYLIFGPPGTGKTATVTEAILQLLHNKPLSRILVTATSNAAADELALRLLKYFRNACYFDHYLYRLYAASVQREVTDPQLLEYANSNYLMEKLPEWHFLQKFRIIVCTLTTCGRLLLEKPLNIEEHFTHLFIDECGSATEAASIIPIAVCASEGKINAHVILSGDPKQLGPVVQSKTAEEMGFGQSMIERLMNSEPYQRNEVTKVYCNRMLSQLLQNFRSHPDIINISNDLFYNGVLVPSASIDKTYCYVNWFMLPVKNVPIVFDATIGFARKEGKSTSWFNELEITKVVKYINILLNAGINGKRISEDDIGIISPYKKQCHKIEIALRQSGRKIMTASVELFQGKEKPIIIVSTVRTGRQGIGFLDSPQRLNVLLTRAQALLIIIGDPNVLQKDRNWYDVLKRLSQLKVMIGTKFELSAIRPSLQNERENTGPAVSNTMDNYIENFMTQLSLT